MNRNKNQKSVYVRDKNITAWESIPVSMRAEFINWCLAEKLEEFRNAPKWCDQILSDTNSFNEVLSNLKESRNFSNSFLVEYALYELITKKLDDKFLSIVFEKKGKMERMRVKRKLSTIREKYKLAHKNYKIGDL
ncbi:MAG: hypothetical protein GXX85_13640 [Ignavibacteria bacterium]|nr:hypothetical protein [Ignavibacteria bacterium]